MNFTTTLILFLLCININLGFAQDDKETGNALEIKQQASFMEQRRAIESQLKRLETGYDTHYEIDKFYREHEPLDGAKVQYIPFRKGSLHGFVDKTTKKWVIEPKFSQVYAVYPEGAIVAEYNIDNHSNKNYYGRTDYGVTNYEGKWIIPPAFSNLFKRDTVFWGIISGVTKINDIELYSGKNLSNIFNKKGRFLYEILANKQKDFILNDTIAWFFSDTLYNIYNKKGKILKQFDYKTKEIFLGIFNNLLVFKKRDTDFYPIYLGMNVEGKEIFKVKKHNEFETVFKLNDNMYGGFSEGGLIFFNQHGETYPFGIYNGAVGFGFEYLLPYFYSKPYILVQNEETKRFGLLSKKGVLKLPCKYKFLGDYHKGEMSYLDSNKNLIGFIDTNGRTTVMPFLSPMLAHTPELGGQELIFQEDLCLTMVAYSKENGEPVFGYYNRQGKVALKLPDSIIFASHFYDGLAAVVGKESRALGFIDKKGKLIIPMKYSLSIEGAYPLPQIVIPKFINGFAYLKALKGYIDKNGYEYFSGDFEPDDYNFSH